MIDNLYVSVENILSSDGRHKARAAEAPKEVIDAAHVLAVRLHELFVHYKQDKRPKITSGYRTPAANKAAGGAKKSSHLEGRACDFADPDGMFAKWCLEHLHLLEECRLWLEDPAATKGWVHLQCREARARVFKP